MLGKITKIFKFSIVGIVWSILYAHFANLFVSEIWHFSFLSPEHWRLINRSWEDGANIKSLKDYAFALTLILIIPFWLLGFRYFYRLNFLSLLLSPIVFYNNQMIKKYGGNTKRIVLKNIGLRKKLDINAEVESRLKNSPSSGMDTKEIRQIIQEKINKNK